MNFTRTLTASSFDGAGVGGHVWDCLCKALLVSFCRDTTPSTTPIQFGIFGIGEGHLFHRAQPLSSYEVRISSGLEVFFRVPLTLLVFIDTLNRKKFAKCHQLRA